MKHVSVDGLDFQVDVQGAGPPLVLLHGFTGTLSTWAAFVAAVDGFTTIAIDLIGHGGTAAPGAVERYRMDRAVDDLVAVVRALGHDRATWAGYSLGGRTALQVAVRHPDAVSALILEGASPGLESAGERDARIEADERLAMMLEQEGLERFVDHWESIPLWASQQRTLTAEQRGALRAQRLQGSVVGLANSLRGMGTGSQSWVGDRLAQVDVPVLLVAGRLDTKYVAIAEEMGATFPRARVRIIEDAGHAAHLEQPAAFIEAVMEFLRTVSPGF